jgi:hypothetical protein
MVGTSLGAAIMFPVEQVPIMLVTFPCTHVVRPHREK